jgi:hypothetical protein
MDQFIAGFSLDCVHILQNMDIVQFSSSMMEKRFLCSPVEPSLYTVWPSGQRLL